MANENQVSDGRPEGTWIGQSASDLVSFHGVAAVAQAATVAAIGTTASTSSSPVGFTTTNQADALVAAVNAITTALRNKGILAQS